MNFEQLGRVDEFEIYDLHDPTKDDRELLSKMDKISIICDEVKDVKGAVEGSYAVTMPSEQFGFLHEAAIIEYHGALISAWYNCPRRELKERSPIRFARSTDGGKTWSEPEIIADDESGDILYCPPVFGIDDDKLYLLMNQMVGPDIIHSLDLFVYDEGNDKFELLWSRPIPFKLNTNVYKLSNGKLILPGRVCKLDGFPTTPAVLISDSGKIDAEWRIVKVQQDSALADGSHFVHPELSLIVEGENVYAFCRNDERKIPVLYVSNDNGEHWSSALASDLAFSNSKIYSGTLSDGRKYVVGNAQPGRGKLVAYFADKNGKFNKRVTLQNGFSTTHRLGWNWHYPSAVEYDGKLFVIYTVNCGEFTRGAVVSVVDIKTI